MKGSILLIYSRSSPFPQAIGLPLTVFAIGEYLERHGFKSNYFDERIHNLNLLKKFLKEKPLMVGLSTSTSFQIITSLNLAKFIRKIDSTIPLIWGGHHPSMTPIQTAESEYVDFVVYGEGENTIIELANALSKGETNFETINGLVWKKNNKIIMNKPRVLMNYDDVPSPFNKTAKAMLKKYLLVGKDTKARQPVYYLTSRGCSFKCGFCYNTFFTNNTWRARDPKIIRKELTELRNLGVKKIFFADDNLGGNVKHVEEVCKITKDLGLKWSSCMRIDFMNNEEIVKKLDESGCEYLLFGIESGSEKIMRHINKQQTIATIKKGVANLAKTKIIPMYSFMFGFPTEKKEDILASFDLVDDILKIDPKASFMFQIYTPYPGTPLYNEALKFGFKPPKKLENWSNYVMDEVNGPWIKNPRLLKNLFITSVLAFRSEQLVNTIFVYPLHKLAQWRWKHRYFNFCFERLIYDSIKKVYEIFLFKR